MPNQFILQRLQGIQAILNGTHQSSSSFTNNTSGTEREAIITNFLSAVFPNQFRFGTGDATDIKGNRSGQLDVVIENSLSPSLPSVHGGSTRLYPAESIGAVVEVKSNVAVQWQQAVHTASQLAFLERNFGTMMMYTGEIPVKIPLFVIGYTGWNQIQTIEKNMLASPNIDGVLIIDAGLFVSSERFGVRATGPWAFWGLISCLHQAMSQLKLTSFSPIVYALQENP